jgi:transposase InsO family protein
MEYYSFWKNRVLQPIVGDPQCLWVLQTVQLPHAVWCSSHRHRWVRDDISMDFVVGIPLTARNFDSIWVIMNWLTKSTHFIPVNTKYCMEKYAEIYIALVLYRYGVPKMIISDRGSQFVAHFWEQLDSSLGPHLIHSLAYHPQTDGQTERVNQIVEDMLSACVMEY